MFDPFCNSIWAPKMSSCCPFLMEDNEMQDDFASALALCHPFPRRTELFEAVTDLGWPNAGPFWSYRKSHRRWIDPESYVLEGLLDRVSSLEDRFDMMMLGLGPEVVEGRKYKWSVDVNGAAERKYKWSAEIDGPVERKYKWCTEIDGPSERKYKWSAELDGPAERKYKLSAEIESKKKKTEAAKKSYKWSAEIKGKDDNLRKYAVEVTSCKKEEKREKQKKAGSCAKRVIEIGEPSVDRGAIALRQAFAKRAGSLRAIRGKNKELSPQDAALLIQMSFKAYLLRRSRALRALRELAIAKAKLKEIRALFNNFSYRRQVARDAEERQRFSEKIIVVLLTVDAIEGADLMVRGARKSMIDELEAMLDVVDPQPADKLLSLRRRKFDVPDGAIRKEIEDGVAQVVQLLETDN